MILTNKDRIKLALLEKLTWTANNKCERFIYGAASSGTNFMVVDEEDIKEYVKDYINSNKFGKGYTSVTLSKVFNVPLHKVNGKIGENLKQELLNWVNEEDIYYLATQYRLGMPISSKEILEVEMDERVYYIYFNVSSAA
ncbi:hypothetical protein ACH0BF_16305 [Pseudobacillus sp. 179-B 2D1 NHS]|uniref:hypothetical protein n=1 Tax=Pseudobacillus sp. 179-B 2D1 NHS TaxID=3374292 RepID=UPI00387997B1